MSTGKQAGPRLVTEGAASTIAGRDKPIIPQNNDDSQLTLPGVDRAIAGVDPWWQTGAELHLRQLLRISNTVCACDLTDNDALGLPDHPARIGALFRQAAKRGVIVHDGYHVARRASRQGGVHAVWRRGQ